MESFPYFFSIRAVTFTTIMLFSFLWLVLLCIESFARWSLSDQISQSLMVLFIIANTATLILLPVLLLVEFRIWLDAARLLLLIVLQIGSAAAGTYWNPRIQCPNQTPDDIGVCQLIGAYTMIACWIIPVILILYSAYFAVGTYLQSRIPVIVGPEQRSGNVDPEMGSTNTLVLWREKLREIIGVQGSNSDTAVPPRPLVLPSMNQSGPSSQPQRQSTLPIPPHRQSTLPSSSSAGQSLPSVPTRHHSLPAFKHGNVPHLQVYPMFTSSIPHPAANRASTSQPQTPSSLSSCSNPSPSNPFGVGPNVARGRVPGNYQRSTKHLSMMPLLSSPGGMQNDERSPTPRPTRARLSKPVPAHLL